MTDGSGGPPVSGLPPVGLGHIGRHVAALIGSVLDELGDDEDPVVVGDYVEHGDHAWMVEPGAHRRWRLG
jgi:hypothetical protein